MSRDAFHAACVLFATSVVQGAGLTAGWMVMHAVVAWIAVHP